MKFWNLSVKRGNDGGKHLDVHMHGVIDGGWYDDAGVDSSDLISELNQHLDAKTVGVRINSMGGSAFGGVAIYNALQQHPGDVTCYVEGMAASAASLVAMAGKCVMGKGSMMMIHSPLTVAMGNAEELRKTADVLDKVQDALATIYTAKTGKSLDDINNMLDDETYMTAQEAVDAGFADEIMPDTKTDYGPGSQVPAEQDDANDDDGDAEDRAPRMTADGLGVVWAGVTFPATSLPQQILAMARPPKPAPVLAVVPPEKPEEEPAPIVALEPPITRDVLDRRAPELVKALLDEGRSAGIAAERARLKDIDDLGVKGCAEMVYAAKYGERPTDAAALAVAVVKAGQVAGADLLAIRRNESEPLAKVATGSPDNTGEAAEQRHVNAIVAGLNSRH